MTFLVEKEYPAAGLAALSYLFHEDAASAGAVERGHAVQGMCRSFHIYAILCHTGK